MLYRLMFAWQDELAQTLGKKSQPTILVQRWGQSPDSLSQIFWGWGMLPAGLTEERVGHNPTAAAPALLRGAGMGGIRPQLCGEPQQRRCSAAAASARAEPQSSEGDGAGVNVVVAVVDKLLLSCSLWAGF